MAPQYPFARKTPSALASSSTTNNLQNGNENGNGRPIVVSASGVAPNSPAAGLSANSPSTLRARIPSPRTSTGIASTFQNDTSSYPSPPTLLSKVKSKRKKNKSEGGKQGWLKVEDDSPSRGREIPRYDARGYPTRDRPPDPGLKQESAKSVSFSKGHRPSKSRDSFVSDVSSTGAGIDGDPGRFLSPERPSSYYAPIDGASPSALYPPTISYALSAPSYSPYEINPARMVNPQPVPSLYRDSMISLHSNKSEDSMTHFRKYDSLRDMYPAFSISSKGGKRHLGDMVGLRIG